MSITLNWSNRGQAVTVVKIYRGTSRQVAPTLLTTLDTAAETYTDETANNNTLYYYRVSLVIDGNEVPGALIPVASVVNLGPGPTTLMSGTMEWGYFGRMTPTEFFTSMVLRNQLTPTPANWANYANDISWWRKYAWFGKILYIPDVPIYTTTSTASAAIGTLYLAGMYYGNGRSNKNAAITVAATVQNRTVTKDNSSFIIRAPGANVFTDPTTSYFNSNGVLDYYASEAMLAASPSIGTFGITGMAAGNTFQRCTPLEAPGTVLAGIATQHMGSTTQLRTFYNYSMNGSTANWGSTQTLLYLPVLELVQ